MVTPRVRRAVDDVDGPLAVLDVGALTRNARALVARAGGLPIRVASKSVRVPQVLDRVLAMEGFAGVLAFSLPEAIALSKRGVRDIVVAYPTTHTGAVRELAEHESLHSHITVMIDSPEHLAFLSDVAPNAPLRLAIDLDGSLRLPGGIHIGTRRSPLREPDDVRSLAASIPEPYRLVGLMCYEGQVAGVGNAGRSPKQIAIRQIQRASMSDLASRRTATVAALREVADLEFVNGGGTGSLEVSAAEGSLTEVAAGSGLYSPGLFDHYGHFRHEPALFLASPVVRRPGPDWVTVFEGGWIASGALGPDRLPVVDWPAGLSLSPTEGYGEVQTPLTGKAAAGLSLGDKVFFRHAKAGEVLEHFPAVAAVEDSTLSWWNTYRGEGWRF